MRQASLWLIATKADGTSQRAVRRILADTVFKHGASELAAWGRENHGADRGAQLVEALAGRGSAS